MRRSGRLGRSMVLVEHHGMGAFRGRARLMPSSLTPTLEHLMTEIAVAGRSVRQSSRRLYKEAGWRALGASALIAFGLALGAGGGGGVGALFIAGGLFLGYEARQRANAARRFTIGAISEERSALRLWVVEARGWLVAHDVQKRGGGNIDHVIHSPLATFVIDTKTSRWTNRDIAQAHRHQEWAALQYGGEREIVPVICVERSDQRPEYVAGVYVVGGSHLSDFLFDRG